MPLNKDIKKVLVIGSGPIVIGQAAEFDYAGAQACRVLKDEGIEVVLVNSNPATIMTDSALADHIYLEPLTEETVKRIIEKKDRTAFWAVSEDRRVLPYPCSLQRTDTLIKWVFACLEQTQKLLTRLRTDSFSGIQW